MVGSRGSDGSSLVATLVNITAVNPLPAHYLCFKWRYFKYVDSSIYSGFGLEEINCPVCYSVMSGDGHNIPFETFMVFERHHVSPTPWLTARHGYDPTSSNARRGRRTPNLAAMKQVGGQAVLGRQNISPTPWLTERHG